MKVPGWAFVALMGLVVAGPAGAVEAANAFHPLIKLLDAKGQAARGLKNVDTKATCGKCHDVDFIRGHSSHGGGSFQVDCQACHFKGGEFPGHPGAYDLGGSIKRPWMTLRGPEPGACLACHGDGSGGLLPLFLSASYMEPLGLGVLHPDHLSLLEGSAWSGQAPANSGLNLQGKDSLHDPWDVHAARLLTCVSCHASPNGPARQAGPGAPSHLKTEPRHLDLADFLARPDHRLTALGCRACHEPGATHGFLPYASRHFERLACQACHVPRVYMPVLMEEDRTQVLPGGRPRRQWRNQEGDGADPGTALTRPFAPFLLPVTSGARPLIYPANIVVQRAWLDAAGKEISFDQVRLAWAAVSQTTAGKGAPEGLVAAGLARRGFAGPHVVSWSEVRPIWHGIQPGRAALRACGDCHARGGRMDAAGEHQAGFYLPGSGSRSLSSRLGFLFFVLVALGVAGHALGRALTAQAGKPGLRRLRRVYMYGAYERLWHWLMALGTVMLIWTGFEIHFAGEPGLLGFPFSVGLHNVLAALLLANAGLSLFYHLATARIRQFIPQGDTLARDVLAQAKYYLDGIFAGAPHPGAKAPDRKLNPLQQLTYMGLLNVLLPLQVVTGLLMWVGGRWPGALDSLGGLSLITPLHALGAWMFLAFALGHVYLTTTGTTLLSNLRAMIDGYDQLETKSKEGKP